MMTMSVHGILKLAQILPFTFCQELAGGNQSRLMNHLRQKRGRRSPLGAF